MRRHFSGRETLQVALLIFVSIAIFCNAFQNSFNLDDTFLITDNRYIRDHKNLFLFFTPHYWNQLHPFPGEYRPVRTISLALDYYFWKLNPAGYLVTNVLLHTINVVLIFCLVLIITGGGGKRPGGEIAGRSVFLSVAFVTAFFFATHPIHTESINFIKNRSDLLAFLFFLLTFLLFIRQTNDTRRMLKVSAWFCFTAAVLSKEMALILPGVLALYAVCFLAGAERKRALIRVVPYGAIVFGYLWFRHSFIRPAESIAWAPVPEGIGRQALTVIKTAGIYFKMLLAPFPLNIEHAFKIPGSLWEPGALLSLLVLLLLGIIAGWTFRRAGVVFFAISWMLLTLLPAANFIYLTSRPIAEQRLYIPSLGFCLLLGCGIRRLSSVAVEKWLPLKMVVISGLLTAIIAGFYTVSTVRRNFDWRDDITLYSRTVAVNPGSARIHYGLARALYKAQKAEQAYNHYLIALNLAPNYIEAHNGFGCFLSDGGYPDEAVRHFLIALRLDPDHAPAHNNLGKLMFENGETEQAVHHFSLAVQVDPDNAVYQNHLGKALFVSGRKEEAVSRYLTALRAEPDNAEVHNNLGIALGDLGRFDESVGHFLTALRLKPDYAPAYTNLGLVLVMTGSIEEAIRRFPADLRARLDLARVYNGIGTIYLQLGQSDQAARYFNQARGLTPDRGSIYYSGEE